MHYQQTYKNEDITALLRTDTITLLTNTWSSSTSLMELKGQCEL